MLQCILDIFFLVGDTTNEAPTLDDVDITKQAKLLQASTSHPAEMSNGLVSDENNTATEDEDTAAEDTAAEDTAAEDTHGETDTATETECDTTDEKEDSEKGCENISPPEMAATGDAPSGSIGKSMEPLPKRTPEKLLPKSVTDQYKIVCQCGAKNCRKYLF